MWRRWRLTRGCKCCLLDDDDDRRGIDDDAERFGAGR
jgi:hypothetical protein